MAHLLDDCWLILGRAEKQFDALHAEIVEFFKTNAPVLTVEPDDETGEQVVQFAQEPVLPREWGFDLGQSMNNARIALDHLVYALAVEGGGQPERDKTAFPIFESRDEYWKIRGRGSRKVTVRDQYLAGVRDEWRKRIDAVQPHRHSNPGRVLTDPLAVLGDVANTHKHKLLKAARVTIMTPHHVCYFTSPGIASQLIVRFKPGTTDVSVEAKMEGTQALTDPGLVIHPKLVEDNQVAPGIVFGEPPRPLELGAAKDAIRWARAIVKWLEPAFDPRV